MARFVVKASIPRAGGKPRVDVSAPMSEDDAKTLAERLKFGGAEGVRIEEVEAAPAKKEAPPEQFDMFGNLPRASKKGKKVGAHG